MLFVAVGFVVGVLIAYSGVGAGALMTPILVLLGGIAPDVAVGSDLLFALVTKIAAFAAHAGKRTVDRALLIALTPGGIAGSVAGVLITRTLRISLTHSALEHILKVLLAIALCVAAVAIAGGPLLRSRAKPSELARLPKIRLFLLSFVVGATVALTSIGAGSLTLPLLLLLTPAIPVQRLVGTDIAFAVVLLIPALAGHATLHDVNVRVSAMLVVGSIPGTFVGAFFVKRLPELAFRFGMSAILFVVAALMVR